MNWKWAIVAAGIAFALLTSSLFVMAVTPVPTGDPYDSHAPIKIEGNDNFTAANGVTGGSGTPTDPYMIEGWEFDGKPITAVSIRNTTANFIVRDLSIHAPLNPSAPGVWLRNCSFGQVNNVTIDGRSIGVKVELYNKTGWNRDIFVVSCRIVNTPVGIQVNDTTNVVIKNNTISASTHAGILLTRTIGAQIVDNLVRDSARAGKDTIASVHIEKSNGASVLRNRIVASSENGLETNGSGNLIIDSNRFEGLARSAVSVTNSSSVSVDNNVATGRHNNSLGVTFSGIYFVNVTDATVIGNQLVRYAMYFEELDQGWVAANRLMNGTGLSMLACSNTTVEDNRLVGIEAPDISKTHETHALVIQMSADMTVDVNAIAPRLGDNGGVLDLNGFDRSVLSNNVFISGNLSTSDHITGISSMVETNIMVGMHVQATGNDMSYYANNLTKSSLGIMLTDSNITDNLFWNGAGLVQDAMTTGTSIYHNDFMTGAKVTSAPVSTNAWDNGYPSGGNFWADNATVDDFNGPGQNITGPDGIGDSNLTVPGGAVDRYPLTTPVRLVDVLSPITMATETGPRVSNGWFNGTVSVKLAAYDDLSGGVSIHWSLDGADFQSYSTPVSVSGDGKHTLEFFAEDADGNSELTQSIQVNIDSKAPTVAVTAPPYGTWMHRPTMFVQWSTSDATSGSAYAILQTSSWKSNRSETRSYLLLTSMAPRHYTINITAVDDAGNTAVAQAVFVLTYDSSISSWHGPWGALFNLALLADFVVVLAAFYFVRRYRAPEPLSEE